MTKIEVKVIKRDGQEAAFDINKIERSIVHANMDVSPNDQMPEGRIRLIAEETLALCESKGGAVRTDDIRENVETRIIAIGSAELAKKYIRRGACRKELRKSA